MQQLKTGSRANVELMHKPREFSCPRQRGWVSPVWCVMRGKPGTEGSLDDGAFYIKKK